MEIESQRKPLIQFFIHVVIGVALGLPAAYGNGTDLVNELKTQGPWAQMTITCPDSDCPESVGALEFYQNAPKSLDDLKNADDLCLVTLISEDVVMTAFDSRTER